MPCAKSIVALFFFVWSVAGAPQAARPEIASQLESARRAFQASRYVDAVRILTAAAAVDPLNAQIPFWLTRTYFELGRDDDAVRSGERAVALAPQDSESHHWLGKAYGEKASHASIFSAFSWARKTHREFETAVRLDGRNFAARQDLIEYLCSAPGIAGGGEDKANLQIAELAAMDAAEGYYAAGNCRRQKRDYPAADAAFDRALDAAPRSADLIYDIGDYAMKRRQPDRLLAVAVAGRKTDAKDPRGEFYRAVALILRKEEPAEAERLLRSYLEHAPLRSNYPRPAAAHEWLGRLFENEGKTAAAASEYQLALDLDPKNKALREALKRLSKLPGS